VGARAAGFACKASANFVGRSKLRENHVRWEVSRLFVRRATEDCSCALVDIDVLEEGRDLAERGGGKRLWREVSVVGAKFSTDASRSRA
jgi:hypothetical protein